MPPDHLPNFHYHTSKIIIISLTLLIWLPYPFAINQTILIHHNIHTPYFHAHNITPSHKPPTNTPQQVSHAHSNNAYIIHIHNNHQSKYPTHLHIPSHTNPHKGTTYTYTTHKHTHTHTTSMKPNIWQPKSLHQPPP